MSNRPAVTHRPGRGKADLPNANLTRCVIKESNILFYGTHTRLALLSRLCKAGWIATHHRVCLFILLVAGSAITPANAASTPGQLDDSTDFQLALLRYTGGQWDPRHHGLPRLAWEIRHRTSVAITLDVATVDATDPALFNYPLLMWQGVQEFPPLSDAAIGALRQYIRMGGTLVIDVSDARVDPNASFYGSVLRELKRVFPQEALARINPDHVLYKTFYLLDRHGGRVPTRAFLEGMVLENRLAVILIANDMAGAMARDAYGEWDYDVGPGGDTAREMSFRLGINVVMYALCLDYKADMVHIPFILQRRR